MRLNRARQVMTNAEKLASIGGGGTNCSAPLAQLNARKAKGDLVIFVSDNESWVDAQRGRGTATMREWSAFKLAQPAGAAGLHRPPAVRHDAGDGAATTS